MSLTSKVTAKLFCLLAPDFQHHEELKELSYNKNTDSLRKANPIHHFQNVFSDFNSNFH